MNMDSMGEESFTSNVDPAGHSELFHEFDGCVYRSVHKQYSLIVTRRKEFHRC